VGLTSFPQQFPETCFAYELALEPEERFHQAEFPSNDGVFWISVTAVYPADAESQNQWGWMTRPHVWRQGAVMPAITGERPTHDERLFPGRIMPIENSALCRGNQGYDMCFELLTDPPWIKWDQPYTGIREWPHYGDEVSLATEEPRGQLRVSRRVADNWPCETQAPVVAIVWDGSYLGYGYEPTSCVVVPPPRMPDYFLLSFWTDAPADAQTPFGHPGEMVWEYKADRYDEVLAGYDRHPLGEPNEAVFRYSVALPEREWFVPSPGRTYWFSVLAVFKEATDPVPYDWGWTNHAPMFEPGAVIMDYRLATKPQWRLLRGPEDRPIDMSFTLFTVPQMSTSP